MIVKDPFLLEVISKETSIEQCNTLKLFEDLKDNLSKSEVPGSGLAAIQIGHAVRAGYIKYKDIEICMINPVIVHQTEPFIYGGEGCLSSPGKVYNTRRYRKITVEYIDYSLGGNVTEDYEDYLAVVWEHELDHFDGILNYKREYRSIKIGRNDKCFCGSGKKYKNCCLSLSTF